MRSLAASILERIEHVGAGHHDREGSQCVLDPDRAVVAGEHVGQAAIGLRGLVEVGAMQENPANPNLHSAYALFYERVNDQKKAESRKPICTEDSENSLASCGAATDRLPRSI